jgi:hypothetical protein
MDYERAVHEMGAHDSFVCCIPFLGLPVSASFVGDLLEPARREQGRRLPVTFEVERIEDLPWLIHDGRVVLRPTMLPHRAELHVGGPVDLVSNERAGLAAAVDIECRQVAKELVAERHGKGWAVGFGAVFVHGATLEGALRNLVPPLERLTDT